MAKVSNIKNVDKRYKEYMNAAHEFASYVVTTDEYTALKVSDYMREEINKLRALRNAWHNEPFFIESED